MRFVVRTSIPTEAGNRMVNDPTVIDTVENYHEADVIFRTAIAELFKTHDAIDIIKMKEVYEILEGAHDRCADVTDVFEDIALKYG